MRLNKIVLSLAALFALAAQADIVRYTDRAAYDAATGSNTLIDFEAQGNGSAAYYGSALTVGDVTFTENAARLFVLSAGFYGDAFTSQYLNNNSGASQVGIQFTAPVYGFALDLAEIYSWGNGSLQETFTFAGESVTVDLAGFQTNNVPVGFVGFTSTTAFSSIAINDPSHALAIDNFAFTSNAVAAKLPEPASVALVGLALLGCGVARKRRAG